MSGFTSVRTQDGVVIARDPATGTTISGLSLTEAYAELRRLAVARPTQILADFTGFYRPPHVHAHTREADRERAA